MIVRLIVEGGKPLKGQYQPAGSSNEAISLIAASLLTEAPVQLTHVPQTDAVQKMLELASEIGTSVTREADTLHLETVRILERNIHADYINRSVAAILFLAPILARRETATLEWDASVGRLHTHLTALRDLGIKCDIQGSDMTFTAHRWEDESIVLVEASVTATALICMLAAALGKKTTIHNAASEPHLIALQHFLMQIGVNIDGVGSNLLTIYGSDELRGATQEIQVDHIEVASVAAMSAMMPGHITIAPVNTTYLRLIQKVYARLGVQLIFEDDTVHVPAHEKLMTSSRREDVDVEIDTAPWPGFPSDLIAITTVIATQTNGTTLIHEKMFNNRLLFVDKLKAMGAQIILCDPHRAIVVGRTPLQAEYIDTPDVRIGLAMLCAALVADGQSTIDRAHLISRNFEDVVTKLIALGAAIEVSDA
jgi:UDP-N-acetylglucosamine 1-carboxyvinyltransferase